MSTKTAIVYKTLYGSTEKYAKWINKEIKSDLFMMDSVNVKKLKSYDRIIVMSGTYAGRMPLTSFLGKNWESLKDKKIVIVAVGAAPMDNWWSKISYFFVPGKIKKSSKYFKVHGPYKGEGEMPKEENLSRIISFLKK